MFAKKIIADFILTLTSISTLGWIYTSSFSEEYALIGLIGVFILLITLYAFNAYQEHKTIFEVVIAIIKSWVLVAMVVFGVIFIAKFETIGRTVVVLWISITPLVLILFHYLLSRYILLKKQTIYVYGSHYSFALFEQKRLKKQKITLTPIDTLEDVKQGIVVINTAKHIPIIANTHVQYISLAYFIECYLRKCHIDQITDIQKITGYSNSQKILKTTIDYTLSLILLPVFILSILLSTMMITIQSRGSIFFTQHRVGKYKQIFNLYKFRSMHENSHFDPYTQKSDSRIFPYGNLMRKMRIDELPQVLNILKGDMSLIGPRAEWDILVKDYEEHIPYYHLRSLIRPGISGWAQVNYPYGTNVEDTKQKLMYDLYYIKNWSLALELEIMTKTMLIIISKKGV